MAALPVVKKIVKKTTIIPKVFPVKSSSVPSKPVIKEKFTVHNSFLIDSLRYMKENSLMGPDHSSPHFDSVSEAEDYARENIVSSIRDRLNSLKSDISLLQKKGYELHIEGIRLLEVPLKIKVWLSTSKRKDLENVYSLFSAVAPRVSLLMKEFEAKEAEKDRKEKIANASPVVKGVVKKPIDK